MVAQYSTLFFSAHNFILFLLPMRAIFRFENKVLFILGRVLTFGLNWVGGKMYIVRIVYVSTILVVVLARKSC